MKPLFSSDEEANAAPAAPVATAPAFPPLATSGIADNLPVSRPEASAT